MENGFDLLIQNEMFLNPGVLKQDVIDFVGLPKEEEEEEVEEEISGGQYKSFRKMMQDMKKLKESDFIPCDDPKRFMVGFIDLNSGKYFEIHLSDLKISMTEDFTESERVILKETLSNEQGRISFAKYCSGLL